MIAALARGRAPAERGSGSRATMLAALSLASFLVVFDDSAVAVALPSLQRDLHLLTLGVAIIGALLGAATGQPMTSRLSLGLKVNAAVAAVAAVWFLHPDSRAAHGVAGLRPAPGDAEGRG